MIGAEATVRSEMMAELRAEGALGFAKVKMHLSQLSVRRGEMGAEVGEPCSSSK